MKEQLNSLTQQQLTELMEQMGQPAFRAKQIFRWIHEKQVTDFSQMTDQPKSLLEQLSQRFELVQLVVARRQQSKDGTIKFLFQLPDGNCIETVLMRYNYGNTVCVSTQVGCRMGCRFCASTQAGLVRSLTAGEIAAEVYAAGKDIGERISHIVLMGIGEPLDNFDNVTKTIRILSESNGLSISTRRQTISTSGIAPKIKKLGMLDLGVQLAISLHAVDDTLRNRLIPMNKAYNIAQVLDEVRAFPVDMRKRVMFEYLMIKDLNDSLKEAKKLLALLNGIRAKVNVILFNPHEGSEFLRPSEERARAFADFLTQRGLLCTIRESKGLDISAACGQLREKVKEQNVSYETK